MTRDLDAARLGPAPDADRDEMPSWEEVARHHGGLMYTVAYRLCGNHDEAEDIVQTALMRVRGGLDTYRPGNLRGWLSRITTNVFLDEVRRRKRRPSAPLPEDPERVLPGSPGADEALDSTDLPGYVQEALASLPVDFRSALVLCDVVGMSYPEIADSLAIPVGTVRSRIHRARRDLRDLLIPHLDLDDPRSQGRKESGGG